MRSSSGRPIDRSSPRQRSQRLPAPPKPPRSWAHRISWQTRSRNPRRTPGVEFVEEVPSGEERSERPPDSRILGQADGDVDAGRRHTAPYVHLPDIVPIEFRQHSRARWHDEVEGPSLTVPAEERDRGRVDLAHRLIVERQEQRSRNDIAVEAELDRRTREAEARVQGRVLCPHHLAAAVAVADEPTVAGEVWRHRWRIRERIGLDRVLGLDRAFPAVRVVLVQAIEVVEQFRFGVDSLRARKAASAFPLSHGGGQLDSA